MRGEIEPVRNLAKHCGLATSRGIEIVDGMSVVGLWLCMVETASAERGLASGREGE